MANAAGVSTDPSDTWLEAIVAQWNARQIAAQISLRTVKSANGLKEHHVQFQSDDDECFVYRTTINVEEYRRLTVSNNFIASFDNLPQYLRQLLRAAKQENEYGQSYNVNILSAETLGIAPRVELLITTRQADHAVQNNVLSLPLTSASDAEFKEYLTMRFEKLKKDKEQLRRSASLLESQLRRERARSRELEDKNHWLRKELKFTQNLLKSADSIQKHYEVILSLRHRGETGSTVVTIGDGISTASNVLPLDTSSIIAKSSTADMLPPCDLAPIVPPLPPSAIRKTSLAFSQFDDDNVRRKTSKRKVSFCNAMDTDSESDADDCHRPSVSSGERKNPPPRKFAAAVLQLDDQLVQIRNQEQQRHLTTPGEKQSKWGEEESSRGSVGQGEEKASSKPLLPWSMPPSSMLMPTGQEGHGEPKSRRSTEAKMPFTASSRTAGCSDR